MFLTTLRSVIVRVALTAACVFAGTAMALAGVGVSSPSNGATVGSPVHFVASASSTFPVTAMRIYVDGQSVFATSASSLDTYVGMAPGWHVAVVQSWDARGTVSKAYVDINIVGSSSSTPTAMPGGNVHTNIDQMQGWETCDRCAGAGGTGPSVPHYVAYGISSPSMDGQSVQFTNAGTMPYSDAIWWKQLGADDNVTHFVYDLYFYIKDPRQAEALEFDVNQSAGGLKYIFGTQCGINEDHQWDVWGNNRWIPTGVGCPVNAYAWNHLTAEFYRQNGMVHYVAITLNGNKAYINRAYGAVGSGANEINVAFQMDQVIWHPTFSVWLDRVNLTQW
jgi:hypothetical protein